MSMVTEDIQETGRRRWAALGGWGTSVGVHAGVAVAATLLVFAVPHEVEMPPMRPSLITAPQPSPETRRPEPRIEERLEIPMPVEEVVAPASPLLPMETVSADETMTLEPPSPAGDPVDLADSRMDYAGQTAALGVGGPSAGIFGNRTPSGQKRALQQGGGTLAHLNAVKAALRWFKRHQSPDGRWSAVDHWTMCEAAAGRCEPGSAEDSGGSQQDVAMTGLAVLCFLGAGHDHRSPTTYRATVRAGIDYLLSVQREDGRLGTRNYEHPIATMVLAEALAMTGDVQLKEPAQRAVRRLLACQNPGPSGEGLGWDYIKPTSRHDTSVTGWNIMALKSAHAAGLEVGTGMAGGRAWLAAAWAASNAQPIVDAGFGTTPAHRITAYDQSRFAYVWRTGDASVRVEGAATDLSRRPGQGKSLEGVGLVCGIFTGRVAGDPLVESLANTILAHHVPTRYPCNTYALYYNTLGLYQMGPARWRPWNTVLTNVLLPGQRLDEDCRHGSWDWEGTVFHGHRTGRVLSTALNTLSLEVYYRYARVQ